MKFLHIAPLNISGVPITFVKAERALGYESRLVTLGKDRRNYEEDICLKLPFLDFWLTRLTKRFLSDPNKLTVTNRGATVESIPCYWQPNNFLESVLMGLRERFWEKKLERFFHEIDFWNFDVYQLDGGLEFFRDGRTVRKLKALGKKIICCYTGSDLRTRGVIPVIDRCADLNVTLEFDHIKLHPKIHHVLFPFDLSGYDIATRRNDEIIKIGHAPTNRSAKGSDQIIAAISELGRKYSVELILIENVSHRESLRKKSECHIFVDQIGDLGYGLNSLETLAMEIPTCSCLAPGFAEHYPDHPFVVVDDENIKEKIADLIEKPKLRSEIGEKGRKWVQKYHDARSVVKKIHGLASLPLFSSEASRENSSAFVNRPSLFGTFDS